MNPYYYATAKPLMASCRYLFHRRCLYSSHTIKNALKTHGYGSNVNNSFAISSPPFVQHRAFTKSGKGEEKAENRKEKRKKVCLIVGAGAGIGEALTRRFTKGGYTTVVARRDAKLLENHVAKLSMELMNENKESGEQESIPEIVPLPCDARKEQQVTKIFEDVEKNIGEISVCIFNVGANISFPILETSSQKFYKCWEMACYSGFLVGREAARFMVPRESGKIIFTGATASKRGGANFAAFAVAKSGLRALSQSMARELGPKGIHVSHVIIDGAVDTPWIRENFSAAIEKLPEDGLCNPEHIAEAYWHLANQKKSAWTQEMDLRPYCERF